MTHQRRGACAGVLGKSTGGLALWSVGRSTRSLVWEGQTPRFGTTTVVQGVKGASLCVLLFLCRGATI